MKKLILIAALFIPASVRADQCASPLLAHTDASEMREFQNLYQCLAGSASDIVGPFQVVYSTDGTDTTSTSTSYSDTGLAATITTTGTHRVKITFTQGCAENNNGVRGTVTGIQIVRDTTSVKVYPGFCGRTDAVAPALANSIQMMVPGLWIDSPGAGSHVYKTQMNNPPASGSALILDAQNGPGFMMLEEIP